MINHVEDAELPVPPQPQPDWRREGKRFFQWFPSRSLLKAIRAHQSASEPFRGLKLRIAIERHRFWSIVTSADIPVDVNIAGGLVLPHPTGVVVSPYAVIGPNCTLLQQVTIGSTMKGTPVLGAHVNVGAGAKVIGPVTVGDYARIGANAVVTSDIPAGATAVGVPAKIIMSPEKGHSASLPA